jgi:hypothetical protein
MLLPAFHRIEVSTVVELVLRRSSCSRWTEYAVENGVTHQTPSSAQHDETLRRSNSFVLLSLWYTIAAEFFPVARKKAEV